jgi:hypothetical protein
MSISPRSMSKIPCLINYTLNKNNNGVAPNKCLPELYSLIKCLYTKTPALLFNAGVVYVKNV